MLVIVFLIILFLFFYFRQNKNESPPHVLGGRYYDDFPTIDQIKDREEWYKSHPPKVNKEELEKKLAKAKAEMERTRKAEREFKEWRDELEEKLAPSYAEYDKDHFYDVTNERWVKRIGDSTYGYAYLESKCWHDWEVSGHHESGNETDVGELITREEYIAHRDYYSWNNTKYDEDYDENEDY